MQNSRLDFSKSSLIAIVLFSFLSITSSAVFAESSDYNLSGYWNNGKEYISQYQGKLTVFVNKRKRGPFLGWYTGAKTIAVNFSDSGGCCTAKITGDGEIIRWSNGTKWMKD